MRITDTFDGFKARFLIAQGNKPKTYKSVIATLTMFMESTGFENVEDCNANLLEDYLTKQMEARQWAAKTYRNHWQYFKLYFKYCCKKGFLKKNPMNHVARPKLPKAVPRHISREDVKTILHHAEWFPWRYDLERPRNVALLSMMVLTGLRLQEALNLRIQDVNLKAGELTVLQGKNRKDRIVHFSKQLTVRLKEYARLRKGQKQDLPFFTSVKSDSPLTPKNVQEVCNKIQIVSGVYFPPHMLRHTFGKLCLEAKVGLFTIKEEMGHESIKTTQRYLSISNSYQKEELKNAQLI